LKRTLKYLIILLLAGVSASTFAQKRTSTPPLNRILFVFDGSQSMFGRWESGMKIEIAKKLLTELVDSLQKVDNLQMAFRVYGHQSPFISGSQRDCKDTKLEVPFSNGNANKIRSALNAVEPKGTTPIAYSLDRSAGDFPPCTNCRNMIILITDGIEECDGDPCAISAKLQAKGIVLKPFVIGIGLDADYLDRFNCIGTFFDASSESSFKNVLNVVISQALNPTSMQVNLIDFHGNPTETDVPMTFYDHKTGKQRYHLVHTMNHRGDPDTLSIDAMSGYRIVAHTTPEVEKDSIYLTPGIHNVVGIDAAQGDLQLDVQGKNEYDQLSAIIRLDNSNETLVVQDFKNINRYLIGKYDLEILSLPRIKVEDVEITQSHTTKVEIPAPGIANILKKTKGHGALLLKGKTEVTKILDLNPENLQENIVLQPGNYKVVFRPLNSKKAFYTTEHDFTITSGKSEAIRLF
jgi:Ca-activated chloride channel family protein